MSKTAVIFWSGSGNTEAMANSILTGLKNEGDDASLFYVSDFDADAIADYDKLALGCSAMGDEVLEEGEFEPFFASVEGSLSGKKVALFGSYGWGDGQWLRDWEARVKASGAALFEEGLMVNETPDDDALAQCAAFGERFAKA